MSTRTLIELNNDLLCHLKEDPEGFGKALLLAIQIGGLTREPSDGDPTYNQSVHHEILRRGARIKWTRHHSDPCPVDEYVSRKHPKQGNRS